MEDEAWEKSQSEIAATRAAMTAILLKRPELSGDALLNLSTKNAGYDVDTTTIEQCANCKELFDRDDGGEYIDPNDCQAYVEHFEITKKELARLEYNYYCDIQCLARALGAQDEADAVRGGCDPGHAVGCLGYDCEIMPDGRPACATPISEV